MITEIYHKMTAILNLGMNLCNLFFITACPVGCKTYGVIDGDIHE